MSDQISNSVLIVGTYCGLNKGDRLMQQVTIDALLRAGMNPIISCPFPQIDEPLYPNATVTKSHRRNLPRSLLTIILLTIAPAGIREKIARSSRELRDFFNARFVIDTSGDMLTEDYGPHVALSHLIPLIYCVLLKRDFLILAQSIGPFKHLGFLFDWVLAKAKYISAREDITYEYLTARGMDNVVLSADLGFLLSTEKCDTTIVDQIQSSGCRSVIGICPSALFFKKFSSSYPNNTLANFCCMLNTIAADNNIAFLIVPHVMTPSQKMDDAIYSREIAELLTAKFEIADTDLSPSQTKYLISKLDGMVSFRMHGAIAALDSFVPTVVVSYSHKTHGLYRKLRLQGWVVENDENLIANLQQMIDRLLHSNAQKISHLREEIPKLREQSAINIELIERMKN
jgi:polysaccharide pyruvyl transferase WcaK-like protein